MAYTKEITSGEGRVTAYNGIYKGNYYRGRGGLLLIMAYTKEITTGEGRVTAYNGIYKGDYYRGREGYCL